MPMKYKKKIKMDKNVQIGKNCKFGLNVIIEKNVKIGENCYFGNNVIIKEGTIIKDNVEIQDNAIIGKQPKSSPISTRKVKEELLGSKINSNTIICAGAIIYGGTEIGENCFVGDLASIREKCRIDNYVIIGRNTVVEYEVVIGSYTKIQSSCYITGNTTLGNYVFIGPGVFTTNDKYMDMVKGIKFKGPTIKDGAAIGSNSTLLPNITIGLDSIIGAGSVVTQDIPDREVWVGNPARKIKDVSKEKWLENRIKSYKRLK